MMNKEEEKVKVYNALMQGCCSNEERVLLQKSDKINMIVESLTQSFKHYECDEIKVNVLKSLTPDPVVCINKIAQHRQTLFCIFLA